MTQTYVSSEQRFKKWGNHCPICGGHSGLKQGKGERCAGYESDDGEYIFCTREELAGNLELNEKTSPAAFCHKFYGLCNCGVIHNPAHESSNGNGNGHQSHTSKPIAYSYQDEHGRLVYQALRYEPKEFKQRRPDGKGGWLWNMQGVSYVPYRLPDLLRNPDATVFYPEGEKDADNLAHIGLVATTNVQGAGKWREEYTQYFKGRNVVILPDNDKAGKDHAQKVFAALTGVAASVKIVTLPDLSDKGDVSDWLATGGTKETLEQLSQPPKRKFLYASEVQPEPVDYLWTKRLAKGMLTLLVGDPGLGKGLLCAMIAAETTRGPRLPDGKVVESGGVIIMSPEDSYQHTIVPRLIAAKADLSKIILLSEVPDFDKDGKQYNRPISFPEDASILEEAIIDCKASLAIIDPVLAMVNGKYDTHKDQEARLALSRVLSVANRQNCAVVGLFHLNKSQSGNVLYRSGASIAYIAMARIGLFLVPDPDNPENGRVLVNYKNNLAAKAVSLCFTIEQTQDEIGYIKWNGESPYTEQELLNQSTPTDNPKSVQETGLIEVLKENSLAMTPAQIHEQLQTGQTLNALEVMLKRKLEQGVLMRPSKGLYTFNGNPLYTAKTKSEEIDVSNVSPVSDVSNVSNVSEDNIMSTDILDSNVSQCKPTEDSSQADLAKTYNTYIDSYVSPDDRGLPFHIGQKVTTSGGVGTVAQVYAGTRTVKVGFSPGVSISYAFEKVTPLEAQA
jgi:AAA domain